MVINDDKPQELNGKYRDEMISSLSVSLSIFSDRVALSLCDEGCLD